MADEKLISKVKETLDAFRPQLNADGGDMEFICIDDDNKVHLKLTGACGSCPMATKIPEISNFFVSFGNASFANLIVSMNLISICLSLPS